MLKSKRKEGVRIHEYRLGGWFYGAKAALLGTIAIALELVASACLEIEPFGARVNSFFAASVVPP